MRTRHGIAITIVLLVAICPNAQSGLRQALQHYQRNDYIKAVKALEGEKGEKADYIAARCFVKLTELYGKLSEYKLLYGVDYFGELDKGKGKKSAYLPLFWGMYSLGLGKDTTAAEHLDSFLANPPPDEKWVELARNMRKSCMTKDRGRRGKSHLMFGRSPINYKNMRSVDKPFVEEEVEKDKKLLFYGSGSHGTCEGDFRGAAETRLKRLRKGKGRYGLAASYYLGLACRSLLSLETGMPLEYFKEASGGETPAYTGPSKVYAAALEGGDALATAGDDVALKALALKLVSERGGKDAQFVAVAEELREKLADGKDRASLHLLGQYYLNIGEEEKALEVLEQARDKSNKNSIAHNDPVFMLDLARAYYLINRYDECLEILMALSEVFPGLRPLQNSVQGVYAARQKSAGQVRINQ